MIRGGVFIMCNCNVVLCVRYSDTEDIASSSGRETIISSTV